MKLHASQQLMRAQAIGGILIQGKHVQVESTFYQYPRKT